MNMSNPELQTIMNKGILEKKSFMNMSISGRKSPMDKGIPL